MIRWQVFNKGFTRIHVYPFHNQWVVERMTVWQSLLNDLKLFGLRVALGNFWKTLTVWPMCGDNILHFPEQEEGK